MRITENAAYVHNRSRKNTKKIQIIDAFVDSAFGMLASGEAESGIFHFFLVLSGKLCYNKMLKCALQTKQIN